jgi:hypothetical protein
MNLHRKTSLVAAGIAALLATTLSGPAFAAAPTTGPEAAMALGAAGNSQGDAAVAWNGSVYLVVWEESFANGDPTAIFGARVSAAGAALGSPFRISAPDEFNRRLDPAVASNGSSFMVVYRNEDVEGATYGDLDAAIIGGSGVITRPEWRFRYIDNDQFDPAIAWNGSRYLVVWEDGPDPSDPDIFGARALGDGRSYDGCTYESCPDWQIDNPGIPIYATNGFVADSFQTRPTVAANGGVFNIAWQDTENAVGKDNIRGARLQNGVVLNPTPYVVSNAARVQRDPSATANGGKVFTAWTDRRSNTTQDVYADLGGNDFVVSSGVGSQASPGVTKRGAGFLAAWTDTRGGNQDIYAGRITAAGVRQDGNGVPIATSGAAESEVSVSAGANNKQLVAYTKSTGGSSRINFRLIS